MNQTYYPKTSLFSDIKYFGVIDNRYEQRAYSREMPSNDADMSVQYTAIFHGSKNNNFQMKCFDIFAIFAQNIDCVYPLEPPQKRGGSNEYPQSMF